MEVATASANREDETRKHAKTQYEKFERPTDIVRLKQTVPEGYPWSETFACLRTNRDRAGRATLPFPRPGTDVRLPFVESACNHHRQKESRPVSPACGPPRIV